MEKVLYKSKKSRDQELKLKNKRAKFDYFENLKKPNSRSYKTGDVIEFNGSAYEKVNKGLEVDGYFGDEYSYPSTLSWRRNWAKAVKINNSYFSIPFLIRVCALLGLLGIILMDISIIDLSNHNLTITLRSICALLCYSILFSWSPVYNRIGAPCPSGENIFVLSSTLAALPLFVVCIAHQ